MVARSSRGKVVSSRWSRLLRRSPRRRGPRSARDRVQNILLIMPWLMERGQASIDDIAEQFDIDRDIVVEDLFTASFCGVPPYSPLELTDLYVSDDFVSVGRRKSFDERLTLTESEAFGLCVLAEAARELPGMRGDARLESALRKLKSELGASDVDVDLERPEFLDAVSDAVATGEHLRITYWSPSSEEETDRVIHPLSVFSDMGHWYVTADDSRRGMRLHFRVDRIRSLERTGAYSGVAPETVDRPAWFDDAADLPVVKAIIQPSASWIVESYPCKSIKERQDGSFEVQIVANSEHWLGRLAMRAGRGMTIVSPPELVDAGRRAASATLRRYGVEG